MHYQTLQSIQNRCEAEMPGFSTDTHASLLRTWIWEALKRIDTERLGYRKSENLVIQNGFSHFPSDFLSFLSIEGMSPDDYKVIPSVGAIRTFRDATVTLWYYALPLDEEGYPLVPDTCEDAVFAWIDYRFTVLIQKTRWHLNFAMRPDQGLNERNKLTAESLLAAARGDLNQRSPTEIDNLIWFRQNQNTYRNG